MAYEKTVWNTGDIVTAEKLNNLENGVESAQLSSGLYIDLVEQDDDLFMNKTAKQIMDAMAEGVLPVVNVAKTTNQPAGSKILGVLTQAINSQVGIIIDVEVIANGKVNQVDFSASSENDYPIYEP